MKIAFYGHFGTLNTGNEGTLLAVVANLRERWPDWEYCCICSAPEAVTARLDISAIPITSRVEKPWDSDYPVRRRVPATLTAVKQEALDYVRAFRALSTVDALVIPGTGILTDAFGVSAWGPYNLFKWSMLARLRRCKVAFVSVGAGPFHTTAGRLLARSSLALGQYRSFRDGKSLEWAKEIGGSSGRDRIYPDLVFSLPKSFLRRAERRSSRRVVGLGLMPYHERYSSPAPRSDIYARYLEALATFTEWLLERDYAVRLLLGDGDPAVLADFKRVLEARLGQVADDRVIDEPIVSVEDVISQIDSTDVVVATRFHNVLYAMLLSKPVLAISFHHKCTALMEQAGLSRFVHDIDHIDGTALIEQFQELEESSAEVRETIDRRVDEFRLALDEQYDRAFAESGVS